MYLVGDMSTLPVERKVKVPLRIIALDQVGSGILGNKSFAKPIGVTGLRAKVNLERVVVMKLFIRRTLSTSQARVGMSRPPK